MTMIVSPVDVAESIRNSNISAVRFLTELIDGQPKEITNIAITTNGYNGCYALCYSGSDELSRKPVLILDINEPADLEDLFTLYKEFFEFGIKVPDSWIERDLISNLLCWEKELSESESENDFPMSALLSDEEVES